MVVGEAAGTTLGQSDCLADDDTPGSDGPGRDQAIANVRIAVDETLNDGAIVGPPNKNRSIRRFGKGAGEDQVPTEMGFPRELEMLIPDGGAPSEVVINQCVLQQVVTHMESVYGPTTDGQVASSGALAKLLAAWRRPGACIARPTREGYRVVSRPRRTPRSACLGGAKR